MPSRSRGVYKARAGGSETMIQNDTEFQATQYRLTQFETVVRGLRDELSPEAFAACVRGYMLEIQRMREEIDEYLLRSLNPPSPTSHEVA